MTNEDIVCIEQPIGQQYKKESIFQEVTLSKILCK